MPLHLVYVFFVPNNWFRRYILEHIFPISFSPDFNIEDFDTFLEKMKAKSATALKGNTSCRIFSKRGILAMAGNKKIKDIGKNIRYLN